jgi:hypothetical protein
VGSIAPRHMRGVSSLPYPRCISPVLQILAANVGQSTSACTLNCGISVALVDVSQATDFEASTAASASNYLRGVLGSMHVSKNVFVFVREGKV